MEYDDLKLINKIVVVEVLIKQIFSSAVYPYLKLLYSKIKKIIIITRKK